MTKDLMLKRPVFAPKSLQRPRDFPSMRQDSHVSFAIHTQKVATKKKRSKIYLSTAYYPTHLSLSLPFLTVWFLPFPFSPTSFIITSLPLRSSNLIPPPFSPYFVFFFFTRSYPAHSGGKIINIMIFACTLLWSIIPSITYTLPIRRSASVSPVHRVRKVYCKYYIQLQIIKKIFISDNRNADDLKEWRKISINNVLSN